MSHTGILTVMESKRQKSIVHSIAEFPIRHPFESEPAFANRYEELLSSIFEALDDLKEASHNNQSRLKVLRDFLKDLEELVPAGKSAAGPNRPPPCFSLFQKKDKAEQYYYSIWDKLCLRSQATWERDTVERMWGVVESIWETANRQMADWQRPEEQDSNQLQWIQRLLVEYGWTDDSLEIDTKGIGSVHPMFEQ